MAGELRSRVPDPRRTCRVYTSPGARRIRGRSADGGAFGPSCGAQADGGPRFDAPVVPGGYAWWYVDALSDDGAYALTVIAFVGSVFSPYYAWAGRADPLDHCAVNVALYTPNGNRWSMTERRRHAVERSSDRLAIGPSSLRWERGALSIAVNEIGAPIPFPLRGAIRVEPTIVNREAHLLERAGRHFWRPIAPAARVEVAFEKPALRWRGHGYFDCNAGDEPLEDAFSSWTWSRARIDKGAAILYDAERRREPALSLALRFDDAGACEAFSPPPPAPLPRSGWRVARAARSDDASATILRTLEDTPFYARSLVETTLLGERRAVMHESLSLDRFANPIVRSMLPFRMPRR